MDEEIDLGEYIDVIIKRKWLILWIIVAAVLVSFTVNYFIITPVYRGEANLLTPQVGDNLLLSSKEAVLLISGNSINNEIANKLDIPESSVAKGLRTSNSFNNKNSDIIQVSFENRSREKIKEFFNVLPSVLNEQISGTYENAFNVLKFKLDSTEKQLTNIQRIETAIEKILTKVSIKGESSVNTIQYSLALDTYNSVLENKYALEDQLADLKSQINNSHEFIYLGKPSVSNNPVKPKKLFNIAVSGVAAFFFAILLAFFLEYIESRKERRN